MTDNPPLPLTTSPWHPPWLARKLTDRSGLNIFINHPGFVDKNPNAFIASESGITKVSRVYCRLCFPTDINQAMEAYVHVVTEGRITTVQSEARIETYCELINQFKASLKFTVVSYSMGQITDKSRTRRIHSLCRFNMSQPLQSLPKTTIRCTTACTGRGRLPKEAAILPIWNYMVWSWTGFWDVPIGFWIVPDASTITPSLNSFQFTCPQSKLGVIISLL